MNIGLLFNEIFLRPIVIALVLIYYGLSSLHIPGALGFSILILTVVIRLVVWPFMASQLKSAKKMAELKPHLDALKKKHAQDKQALASAQMQLYKEHGVSPAGGCLPALIQIPVFIALYQSIQNVFPSLRGGSLDYLNSLLYLDWMKFISAPNPSFFGLNLATKPSEVGLVLIAIPIITGLLTLVQSLMSLPKPIEHHKDEPKKETQEKESMEEAMGQVQSQMVYFMPVMIGYFAYQFPVGLAIYWNTYTILGIVQQYTISGWGSLPGFVQRIKKYAR